MLIMRIKTYQKFFASIFIMLFFFNLSKAFAKVENNALVLQWIIPNETVQFYRQFGNAGAELSVYSDMQPTTCNLGYVFRDIKTRMNVTEERSFDMSYVYKRKDKGEITLNTSIPVPKNLQSGGYELVFDVACTGGIKMPPCKTLGLGHVTISKDYSCENLTNIVESKIPNVEFAADEKSYYVKLKPSYGLNKIAFQLEY